MLILQFIFPQYSYAYSDVGENEASSSFWLTNNWQQPIIFDIFNISGKNKLPEAGPREPIKKIKVLATAYSSTVDQTDSDPFTTANGKKVKDGIVAANFLPFGTKIKLPGVAGDKVFSVEDRMNRRFNERIDIWFSTREEAVKFGVKYVEVEIY